MSDVPTASQAHDRQTSAGGPSRDASWVATRFDGRSAAGETVLLRLCDDRLSVYSRAARVELRLRDVVVAEAFERAPRMLALPGGVTLEVPDPERTFSRALAAAGITESWIVRMQRAWAAVVVALFALVGAAVWIYVDGLPVAARWIADALPSSFEERIGERVLGVLDERQLRPSSLPTERQQRIAKRFRDAAGVAAPGVEARLLFRAGPVNAFALPGGTIVVFDALVMRANDDQLLGVLGHELGHVAGHHSMRQLVQAVGVGAIAGLLWGDLSGAASNVPLVLGAMRYGRAFEQEADRFALAFLRANGVSARPLLEFFERLEQPDERHGRTRLPEFLSTHPDTGSRIDWLRGEVEADEKPPR